MMRIARMYGVGVVLPMVVAATLAACFEAAAGTARRAMPVPSAIIYPGEIISDALVTDRPFSSRYLRRRAFIDRRARLVGKVARRTLLPGRPVMINAVKDRDLVVRGTPTTAVYASGGLTISVEVMPLESGAARKTIRVRNPTGGKTFSATVQPDGTLRIGGSR